MAGPPTDLEAPPFELELEVPRKPEYVRTVRQAVAALARLHGADEGVVEDIKLAVSEACNTVLATEGAIAVFELHARGGPDGLVIDVLDRNASFAHEVAGPPGEISTEELPFEQVLALPIIRGLVDEVAISPLEGGGVMMRMRVSLGPSAE
jgi:serine/threonine-protein kinase RsbW